MPVKMPLVFVWDNFVLLSRNPRVKSLEDLKGKPISVPLFEDAPPAKITRYLLEGGGLDAKEFNLVFGQPFGRPETIMKDFITGRAEHVLLREPEAGLATAALEKRGIPFSEISYGDLWNELNPGFGSFPNAGVIVKESLYQTHPEVMAIFTEELEAAIDWVNAHHVEAAKLSFDMMHSSVDSVAHFLDRVTFKMVKGEPLKEKIRDFYRILKDQGILNVEVTEELVDLFDQD
jgi:NitT/TauT family transport system substrate-binding protein